MDALEPAQRLYAGGAAREGPAGRAMRLALIAVLLLAAALIFAAFAWADPWPANELGRLMILEYHKVDYPEERWTRTPENFRRDLEALQPRLPSRESERRDRRQGQAPGRPDSRHADVR